MKKRWFTRSVMLLGMMQFVYGTCGADPDVAKKPGNSSLNPSAIADLKTREAVIAIQKKLAPLSGYTATVENKGLSLFANLNPSVDEHSAKRPDKLRIMRTAQVPFFDGSMTSSSITIMIDGNWALFANKRAPLNPDQQKYFEDSYRETNDPEGALPAEKLRQQANERLNQEMQPTYGKFHVARLAEKGEVTIPEYLASMGDLLEPFAQYRLETLKLEKESPEAWVFTGVCNYAMMPWAMTRLTIDKKTGFPLRLETDENQFGQSMGHPPIGQANMVPLLIVRKVAPANDLPDSLFRFPAPKPGEPPVRIEDETVGQLNLLMERLGSVKMREKMLKEGKKIPF